MATASIINLFRDPPNLAVALDHMRAGIPVFPCHAVDDGSYKAKSPRVAGGHRAASLDEAEIRAWWEQWPDSLAGLGLAAAGLMAIDADRHGGPDGVAAWDELAAQHGLDREAFPAVDTPGQGRHVYMRRPADMEATNGEGSLPKGINVRGAGYTIAPGCVLPDGRRYEHDDATPTLALDIPDAPSWLVGIIGTGRQRAEDNQAPACELDTPAAIDRAVAYLTSEAPPAIEGQGGDNTAYRVACAVKDAGISEGECLALMVEHYAPRCISLCGPEDEAEWLAAKVASACANGQNRPGIVSPAVDLAGIVIEPPIYIPRVAPRLRRLSDSTALVRVAWLFKEWMPAAGVMLLAGQSRIGKTFLAIELAGALATKGSFFGKVARERVGVLILVAEGGGTIASRLEGLRVHRLGGMDKADLAIVWAEIDDPADIASLVDDAAVMMREQFGLRLGVVIIDTLSAAYGFDPQDQQTGTAVIGGLDKLSKATGVLVIGTIHYGKDARAGVLGATSWTGRTDVIFAATGEISEITGEVKDRKLSLTKSRYTETGPISAYDLHSVNIGDDEDGDPINVAIVRPAISTAFDGQAALYMAGLEGLVRAAPEKVVGSERRGVARTLLREHCYLEWQGETTKTKTQWFDRTEKKLLKAASIELGFSEDGKQVVLLAPPVNPASLF